ncbi:TPA: hypothetical protein ACIX1O_004786, partial [Escherichia coli]
NQQASTLITLPTSQQIAMMAGLMFSVFPLATAPGRLCFARYPAIVELRHTVDIIPLLRFIFCAAGKLFRKAAPYRGRFFRVCHICDTR